MTPTGNWAATMTTRATTRKRRRPLTQPLLRAMRAALEAALAGDGFDGGDFTGMNIEDFERARDWVNERQKSDGEP